MDQNEKQKKEVNKFQRAQSYLNIIQINGLIKLIKFN